MTTNTNACACENCVGTQCTCGCQNTAAAPAASCQCGDTCNCGDACSCVNCEHEGARLQETR